FDVHAGADPSQIQLAFTGADGITVNQAGELVIQTASGDVVASAPVFVQEGNAGDAPGSEIIGGYVLDGNTASFQGSGYDPSQDLVIDPTIDWTATFGSNTAGNGVAVDGADNSYVVGTSGTTSTNAFVRKYDPSGTLVFSTTVGGSANDTGNAISVDPAGNIYFTGSTASSNFPTTRGVLQTSLSGSSDAYLVKLSTTGDATLFGTYMGGTGDDTGYGVAVTPLGDAVVTGSTANFPVTGSAFQQTYGGSTDAFVARANDAGTAYVFA